MQLMHFTFTFLHFSNVLKHLHLDGSFFVPLTSGASSIIPFCRCLPLLKGNRAQVFQLVEHALTYLTMADLKELQAHVFKASFEWRQRWLIIGMFFSLPYVKQIWGQDQIAEGWYWVLLAWMDGCWCAVIESLEHSYRSCCHWTSNSPNIWCFSSFLSLPTDIKDMLPTSQQAVTKFTSGLSPRAHWARRLFVFAQSLRIACVE